MTQWGTEGSGEGQFAGPVAIAIDKNDNIYIGDWQNADVQKFDKNGKFLLKWGSPGSADGQFQAMAKVAVTPDGNVLVAELGRLQMFSSDGKFLYKLSPDPVDGHSVEFWSISIDTQGNIYVADYDAKRIVKLDSQGNFLATWDGTIAGAEAFKSADDIVVDGQGNVYVTNNLNNLVQKFRQP